MAQGSDICFEHVTFTYPTGEQPAVSDVSFTAKSRNRYGTGGTFRLRQDSPSGPWSPAFMMCRRGALRWAAWNFLRSPRQEVMGKIAFVFQNPKLLKTTLEENIRGGCKNASREDILRAARLAQCDDILGKATGGALTASWVGKASIFPEEKYSGWLLPEQF